MIWGGIYGKTKFVSFCQVLLQFPNLGHWTPPNDFCGIWNKFLLRFLGILRQFRPSEYAHFWSLRAFGTNFIYYFAGFFQFRALLAHKKCKF